jgi:hydrogenase-4 component F
VARSRVVGIAFAVGLAVLLGLPPFAMFASELSIARALADAHLAWALAIALLLITVAFGGLVRNASRMLLGPSTPESPAIVAPATVTTALLIGMTACLALGITAGPLTELFHTAAVLLGGV